MSDENTKTEDSNPNLTAKSTQRAYKRKTLIISYRAQFRIIFYGLFIQALVILALYYFTQKAFDAIVSPELPGMAPQMPAAFYEYANTIRDFVDYAFLVTTIVSMFGFFLTQAVLSNRLVGPVYRMTEVLKKVNSGQDYKDGSLTLRKHDFFTELAEQMAKLLNRKS